MYELAVPAEHARRFRDVPARGDKGPDDLFLRLARPPRHPRHDARFPSGIHGEDGRIQRHLPQDLASYCKCTLMNLPGTLSLAALLGSLAGSATAQARRPSDASSGSVPPFDFTDRPLTIDAVFGLGTPVGFAGGAVEYDLARWLALGAGAGTNTAGLQLAAMGRVRPFTWQTRWGALGIEVGSALARGPYGGQPALGVGLAVTQRYANDHLTWAQFDIGFELKSRSGFHFVAAEGIAFPLDAQSGQCVAADTGESVTCDRDRVAVGGYPEWTPFVLTVMLGWSL